MTSLRVRERQRFCSLVWGQVFEPNCWQSTWKKIEYSSLFLKVQEKLGKTLRKSEIKYIPSAAECWKRRPFSRQGKRKRNKIWDLVKRQYFPKRYHIPRKENGKLEEMENRPRSPFERLFQLNTYLLLTALTPQFTPEGQYHHIWQRWEWVMRSRFHLPQTPVLRGEYKNIAHTSFYWIYNGRGEYCIPKVTGRE